MRGQMTIETSRVSPAQMDLDVGRLTPADALATGGVAVGALSAGAIGGLVAVLAWPDWGWSWWRSVLVLWGVLLAVGGVALAGVVVGLMYRSWRRYEGRLDDWHSVALEAYQRKHGVDTTTVVAEWDLRPGIARDVLLVALWCHLMRGQVDAPWSVRSLTAGPLMLSGRRLGALTDGAARAVAQALADVGLLRGRGARRPGEWTAGSLEDVVQAVMSNWGRVRDRLDDAVELED